MSMFLIVKVCFMEKRIIKLEMFLSLFLLSIPLLLILINNEVRSSISDYAYSDNSNYFVLLLSLAGSMFFYNGCIKNKYWYNIIFGISLFGIALTPHLHYPFIHYFFASVFFIGSILVMIIFSSNKQRFFKIIFGFIIISSLISHFIFNLYSLFWAEWICIVPICIHFIGESIGFID